MASNDTLRWAILGIGRFGMRHARAVQSLPGLELSAVCNRNPERLAAAAAALQVERTCADAAELLGDPGIDVVSVTTHWKDHFGLTAAALDAGKHVLLEKPMAPTAAECWRLAELADKATGKFMVGHICRFDPRVTLAKQAIDAGRIGRIVSMHAKRNLPQAPGNLRLDKISPLLGDGVHDADLMMWLTGQIPSRVYGREIRFNPFRYADLGWAMLEFADQAIGVVETNWGLPPNVPTVIDARLEVVGVEGMLTIDCSQTGLTILDDNGPQMVDTDYWPEQHGRITGALCDEVQYFADCVRHDRQVTIITPSEAARAVAVMETAERSAECGMPLDYCERKES